MPEDPSTAGNAAIPRQTPWFVYLIECLDGSIYTGIATDVAARYATHASGKGARYTRAHPPAKLLACVEYPDRSSASKAEYRIKQLKPAAKRRFAAEACANAGETKNRSRN
jgi:putative endonuclease